MTTEGQITPAVGAPLVLPKPQAAPQETEGQVAPSQGATFTLPNETPKPRDLGAWDTTKDVVKSFGAGALRGTAGLADLPADLSQLVSAGSKYLTGYETPKFDTSFREGMADLSGGFSERKPETTLGRYAGTVGEFAPGVIGASLTGGGSLGAQALRAGTNVVKQAVLPGVASEALGQYAEDSTSPWAEPAARIAGAMLGGIGANKIENTLRGVISPGGGAAAVDLANAARLRQLGVPVSAGQSTKNASILAAEADTAAGQSIFGAAPDSAQAQAFTTAAMRHLGSDAKLATPESMAAARKKIVDGMNDSVFGVVVQPNAQTLSDVADAAKYFKRMAPKGEVGTAFKEIVKLMSSRNPIKAEELVAWRSNLGDLLSSGNAGVRGTAFKMRGIIDDAIEAELNAMGQPQRFAQWKTSRDQYRNYLAMQNALKVAQDTGVNGIVTPKQLMAALASQDKAGIVTGSRGDIGELATLGLKTIKPLGEGGKQGFVGSAAKSAGPLATAAAAGWGALQGAQFMGLNPLVTALGTTAAVATPLISAVKQGIRGKAMNPLVQRYLQNQLVNSTSGVGNIGSALNAAKLSLPSAMEDRQNRKSGGRVSSHEADADQLVRAAERAKKGWSAETEPLLKQSDEAVAHALEVANRSI
jgi:hypothetical protein